MCLNTKYNFNNVLLDLKFSTTFFVQESTQFSFSKKFIQDQQKA